MPRTIGAPVFSAHEPHGPARSPRQPALPHQRADRLGPRLPDEGRHARGRCAVRGIGLPPDGAVDAQGHVTESATQAAALRPLGGLDYGHKGYGLARVVERLCGPLHGYLWGPQIGPMCAELTRPRHSRQSATAPRLGWPHRCDASGAPLYHSAWQRATVTRQPCTRNRRPSLRLIHRPTQRPTQRPTPRRPTACGACSCWAACGRSAATWCSRTSAAEASARCWRGWRCIRSAATRAKS